MKKIILTILAMAAMGCWAQVPHGWWLSMVKEASLPMNLEIRPDEQGALHAHFYSPAQTEEEIAASKSDITGNQLRFESKAIGLKILLEYAPETDTWSGSFKQGFLKADMTFSRCDTMWAPIRPQTPKAPFPYEEKHMRIERKKADVVLSGTLTMPMEVDPMFTRGKEPKRPAVVLVSGSGQQNRDEELMEHKPFAVLADYLARQGIAVLRYDDRGVGGSTGEVYNASSLDFADDAEAMMNWLRKQPGIDPKRVGIIGHSEGGLIAPIVASRNKKTKFIVMLAGPGCMGADVLLQQNREIYLLQGVDSAKVEKRLEYMEALFKGNEAEANEMIKNLSKAERKEIGLDVAAVMGLQKQMETPWIKAFVAIDPAPYLKKARCPILAINGDKDVQVLSKYNLPKIKELAPHAEIHEMPGLNHLMQHADKGTPDEYILIEETMSPEVMQMIAKFIWAL